jgi:hypothetical protein
MDGCGGATKSLRPPRARWRRLTPLRGAETGPGLLRQNDASQRPALRALYVTLNARHGVAAEACVAVPVIVACRR